MLVCSGIQNTEETPEIIKETAVIDPFGLLSL